MNICCLADDAAPAIAADEVRGAQRVAVGQFDVDPGLVLRESDHLGALVDGHAELLDPVGQDSLDVLLRQPEPVVVPGREVARVETDRAEAGGLGDQALGDEPLGDAPLVEHLDRARVEAERAPADELPAGPALQDRHVDPGKGQLARQHQPRRTAPGDQYRVIGR